jgi:hypothetical protein
LLRGVVNVLMNQSAYGFGLLTVDLPSTSCQTQRDGLATQATMERGEVFFRSVGDLDYL